MDRQILKINTADRLGEVKEYYFSTKLRQIAALNAAGKDVINLGIGSPDQPPHPDVVQMLADESAKPGQHGYQSYKGHPGLREAAAVWYQTYYRVSVDPETEILPLIGSKEGLMHICMTYINPGDIVLIPNPGYPTYMSAATISGADVRTYSLRHENDWLPDWDELESMARDKVKIMFVNYPHMPTGKAPTRELFERLVAFAQKHQILLVHDNPYSFILNDHPLSMLSVPGAKEVVIELNSLSKSHNMAGWRIGFIFGKEERVNEILRFKSNMDSGMFLPLQLAAAKALSLGADWYSELNKMYHDRRKKVFELLDLLGADYSKEISGLFVWAKVPERCASGYELSDEILDKANVFITPGGIFGSEGEAFIRVSLCQTVAVFEEAIKRIKKITE